MRDTEKRKNTLSVANNSSNDVDGDDIKVGGRVIVEPRKEVNFQRITKKTLIKSLKNRTRGYCAKRGQDFMKTCCTHQTVPRDGDRRRDAVKERRRRQMIVNGCD